MRNSNLPKKLLHYLRTELKISNLSYKLPPQRIEQGYEAFIYKFQLDNTINEYSKPLVLRLYPNNIENIVYKESVFQNFLKENKFPVPQVHVVCNDKIIFGGEFLLMDFLPGETPKESLPVQESSKILAETHISLHQIDPAQLIQRLKKTTIKSDIYDGSIWGERASKIKWLRQAINWIKENEPKIEKNVICHGDFHQLNLLVSGSKVTGVLDWSACHIGEPERDVTSTLTVLTSLGPLIASERKCKDLADAYLKEYQKNSDISNDKIEYYQAVNCVGYLEWINYGGNQDIHKSVVKRLTDQFNEITGISILPHG